MNESIAQKIWVLIETELPGFWSSVFLHPTDKNIYIMVAANNLPINNVGGQFPQKVSLFLSKTELRVQIFGCQGGQTIYLNPKPGSHLAMEGVKVKFIKPREMTEDKILKSIQSFLRNYKKALVENKARLMYQDIVDYNRLLIF